MRVRSLAREHNAKHVPWPGLQPGPLGLTGALTDSAVLHLYTGWIVYTKSKSGDG